MTPLEQSVVEVLREVFRAMGLTCAGRQDNPLRWSGDDLATDLAPRVAAAIRAASDAADNEAIDSLEWSQEAALSALQGEA